MTAKCPKCRREVNAAEDGRFECGCEDDPLDRDDYDVKRNLPYDDETEINESTNDQVEFSERSEAG